MLLGKEINLKQPRKLFRDEKEILVKNNLKPTEYMFLSETNLSMIVINKSNGKKVKLQKQGGK